MPANRNALIRYKTIDRCLQNRYRRWTLDDLIDACSEALYEYEGIDKGVSRRTVQADIQMMRSDKLGYNAPIVVQEKKYYTYADSDYSITNLPLTEQDLEKLSEAVAFMRQFQGFSHFQELQGMVQKLEGHIYAKQTHSRPVIDFEKNEQLKGLAYLNPLYQAIIQQQTLRVTYQSFKARQQSSFDLHPYLLKEWRNRWFLVGRRQGHKGLIFLALDRILDVADSRVPYQPDPDFDPARYFQHTIGASVDPNRPAETVRLFVTREHAPYLITKPLHASQRVVAKTAHGTTLELQVQHNFELEKEILALGEVVKVLAPARLRRVIRDRLREATERYDIDFQGNTLTNAVKALRHQGHSMLHRLYTGRELRRIVRLLSRHIDSREERPHAQRELLRRMPNLKALLFTPNLCRLITTIDPKAFVTKAIYFDKTPESNWFVRWHQDLPINVAERHETPGYDRWTYKDGLWSVCPPVAIQHNRFTLRIHLDAVDESNGALRVLPGSHRNMLNDAEIRLLAENGVSTTCESPAGGIHLMKPLLLHASEKSRSSKRRRVIHLEFASLDLNGDLTWLERTHIAETRN